MSKITNISHLDKFPDLLNVVKTIAKDLSDPEKATKIIETINNLPSMKDYKPPTSFKTDPQFGNIDVVINGEKVGQIETWNDPTQKYINTSMEAKYFKEIKLDGLKLTSTKLANITDWIFKQPKLRQSICKAKQLCLFPHEITSPIIVDSMETLKKYETEELILPTHCCFCGTEIIYKTPKIVKFIESEETEYCVYLSYPIVMIK